MYRCERGATSDVITAISCYPGRPGGYPKVLFVKKKEKKKDTHKCFFLLPGFHISGFKKPYHKGYHLIAKIPSFNLIYSMFISIEKHLSN